MKIVLFCAKLQVNFSDSIEIFAYNYKSNISIPIYCYFFSKK